jgi:hypothetical protein
LDLPSLGASQSAESTSGKNDYPHDEQRDENNGDEEDDRLKVGEVKSQVVPGAGRKSVNAVGTSEEWGTYIQPTTTRKGITKVEI